MLYQEQGDAEKARYHYEQCVQLAVTMLETKEDFYEALYELALAQLALGNTDEALAAYRRGLDVSAHKGTRLDAVIELELLARAGPGTPGLDQVRDLL